MKKRQHSLNFLIITLINGKIIYCSTEYEIQQDQALWNHLELRNFFINKKYGVLGDAAFFFNPKGIIPKIKGNFFPKKLFLIFFKGKSLYRGDLDRKEKIFNECLSQLRVGIENTFSQIKNFKVLSDVIYFLIFIFYF